MAQTTKTPTAEELKAIKDKKIKAIKDNKIIRK